MRIFLLLFLLTGLWLHADTEVVSVCDRHPIVKKEIMLRIKEEYWTRNRRIAAPISCDYITVEDLGLVDSMQLVLDWNGPILTAEDFRGLENLHSLTIFRLESLEEKIFAHTPKLKTLALINCPIKHLPDGLFEDLQLTALTLADSPLEETSKAAFKGIESVTGLSDKFGVEEGEVWGL